MLLLWSALQQSNLASWEIHGSPDGNRQKSWENHGVEMWILEPDLIARGCPISVQEECSSNSNVSETVAVATGFKFHH